MSAARPHQTSGALTMYTLVEALVRERMHEQVAGAQHARMVRSLSAAQRWEKRVSRFHRAEQRHRRQAESLATDAPSRDRALSWA
ncbi:MAG: hypothetical protein ACTHMS_18325 [Jatrophihabitans sp.]|uniref:hypothetical protein n=1 Tax=Jatrophihabitans sp. TaxID=1932789 RepID=UPI003F81CEE1